MTLYHKNIYLPQALRNLGKTSFIPEYCPHALEEANSDRYGLMELPKAVTFNGNNIVEAEIVNGGCTKLLIRVKYNNQLDIVLAFIPENLIVKTVWFNHKWDKHYTLDRTRYASR